MRFFAALTVVFALGCTSGSGPALLQGGDDERPWALKGTIVSGDTVKEGWVVFDRGGILRAFCEESEIPQNAKKMEHDGYIFPTLIDTHNHAHWNVIPQWRAGKTFESRYGWLFDPAYKQAVDDVFKASIRDKKLEWASLKYAEIRSIVGATTLIQTTYSTSEPHFLARNLDSSYAADSRIQDITAITPEEIHRFRTGLASGKTRRVFLHLGEGKDSDPKCAQEFAEANKRGLVRPGVVIIHGVALQRADFKQMAAAGMYLVWSPKSNEVLYGATAKIKDALEEHVITALAPDWTITGSDNTLEEMKVAHKYSTDHLAGALTPRQLFKMATCDAAKVAGVEERLGQIGFGFAADVFLAPKLDADPYVSLLKTYPKHIRLVFIDGVPIYGAPEALAKCYVPEDLDELDIEGVRKSIHMTVDPRTVWHVGQRYRDLVDTLRAALPNLAPLVEKD